MLNPAHWFRLWQMLRIVVAHGLLELVPQRGLRAFLQLLVLTGNKHRGKSLAVRIRLALEALGPIHVKFGQALSTRPDLLSDEVAAELAKLQDRLPPFSGQIARQTIEASFGKPVSEVFASFDENALAAASIAQVHAATLPGGESVVVKVLRPGVDKQIRRDIALMYSAAALVDRWLPDARYIRPLEIVEEYDHIIHDELDLMREAANAATLHRNAESARYNYVPRVYWDYCREGALTLERIDGIPVTDLDTLRAQGVDFQKLSERGVEVFFTQLFRDNFFHADMHPGNIFVARGAPDDPSFICVDFGIVASLEPGDLRIIAWNLKAFIDRDYRRIAELFVEAGWVPADTRVDAFAGAIRAVGEPVLNQPLKDISFGQFLVRLFRVGRRFKMTVQPQLVLLQKTLLNIEGLGRQLNPDLDVWEIGRPYIEDWAREQMDPRNAIEPMIAQLPHMPELIHGALTELKSGAHRQRQMDALRVETRAASNRSFAAIVGGTLILAGLLGGLGAAGTGLCAGGGLIWWLAWRSGPR